jgi:acyl-CoA reductase-like NAD-dependent aldehyde dehydrogenase
VVISTVDHHGKQNILEYLHRGKYFGIISLLTGEPHSVTAKALNDCLLLTIAKEEIFGPVACIMPAKDFEEAISMIERSPFGHSALIFTSSGKYAQEFENRVPCGNVGINVGVAATQAYSTLGGLKDSFYGDIHGRVNLLCSSPTGKSLSQGGSRWTFPLLALS